jgi:metal-sulfur cluster biosynthetic enzyme
MQINLEVSCSSGENQDVLTWFLVILPVLFIVGIAVAIRRQSAVTRSLSSEDQAHDARVYADSTRAMEATVAEVLAEKARDPRLASMTQEDLVYEVLKECYDPEIPLNVVDLGLIYHVSVEPDSVNVKMSVTSPACPSHVAIREDIRTKLSEAGFPDPKVEVVWEPAWSPQRISEAGRKTLGI